MSNSEDSPRLTSNEGDFGIREDGSFRPKDVRDIQESLLTTARQEFGSNIDLSPGSPPRQLIDLATIELTELWNSLEGTYYSSYFEDAFGVQLDSILALAGVGRLPRRGAGGEVVFSSGDQPASRDIDIPRGTEITTPRSGDEPRIPFKTTEAATLLEGQRETQPVPITALQPWETDLDEQWLGEDTNVPDGTITEIGTPISGIREVYNPLPTGDSGTREDENETAYSFTRGRDRETDAELKTRYENSLASSGKASLEALRSNVYTADDTVQGASIEENNTPEDRTAEGGLPPKSFRVTVLGGFDQNIAQSILETRSAGIESYGNHSAEAMTDDGAVYTEYFDRATEETIYIDIQLWADDTFPDRGPTIIKDNIIRYIGGVSSTNMEFSGVDIGEDVLHDVVFGAAMNTTGARRADVALGTEPDPTGQDDIEITSSQIARTNGDLITVDFTIEEVT